MYVKVSLLKRGENMLLTTKQLCEKLGVSHMALYTWRKEKGMPFMQPSRKIMYDYEKVIEWMEKNKKQEVKK